MSHCSNEIIEISDDSNDVFPNNGAGSSGAHKFPIHQIDIVDSDEEEPQWEGEWKWDNIIDSDDDDSNLDCDFWDDDCLISDLSPKTKLIQGYHLMATCSLEPEPETKQRRLCAELSETFTEENFMKSLKESYKNGNTFEEKHCELIQDPWMVLVMNNVIKEESLLVKVRDEFNELSWNERRMDLYEFFQSEDLKKIDDKRNINVIYNFLKDDLKPWVERLTDLELVEVSATCSFYSDYDFLLVHDDQNENRAVAFVLYLTGENGWETDWGGSLQLFDRNEQNQPSVCTKKILPKNNQLVLFPVSDHSYHQVEEVRCKNDCRLSINGWFHTKEPLKFNLPLYKVPTTGIYSESFEGFLEEEVELKRFISESYVNDTNVEYIIMSLENDSEISLNRYFRPEVYERISKSLSDNLKWSRLGPPNRHNYEKLESENTPETVQDFLNLVRSKNFVKLLQHYSDLKLTKMKWELQRWTPGCYSLLGNLGEQKRFDLIVFFGDMDIIGGETHYVTLEDEIQNALISLKPNRALNLIYGDTGRYTSFVSHYNQSKEFFILIASYFEDESESSD